jgi:hypothetical protein
MKTQKTQSLTQPVTNPKQVWQTLAVAQQETVFQIVVRICSSLIEVKPQGKPDEPKSNH